ncbi:hypothetical protein DB347_22195 [Opitutaceae bacterium EW11]|nr:hypothetical protein DB347_22195 [Opitutaceae bacterium EW11]
MSCATQDIGTGTYTVAAQVVAEVAGLPLDRVRVAIGDSRLPEHADTPQMDVVFVEGADPHIGEFGAKGVGEIGITGIVGAVANAVYHATGKRVRDLPIRVEKLL